MALTQREVMTKAFHLDEITHIPLKCEYVQCGRVKQIRETKAESN